MDISNEIIDQIIIVISLVAVFSALMGSMLYPVIKQAADNIHNAGLIQFKQDFNDILDENDFLRKENDTLKSSLIEAAESIEQLRAKN